MAISDLLWLKAPRHWRAAVLGGLLGVGAWALGWWLLPWCVGLPPDLLAPLESSPRVLDRDGREIGDFPDGDWLRQRPVSADALPSDLVAATLAAEDKRFFEHGGVDFLAALRAARDAAWHRRFVSGASTVSQQLVKISRPAGARTFRAKAYEMLAARQLEMRWTKDEILAAYLNRVEYGNGRRGAAEAARVYFRKPLADLSLAECALLAGLPQAPSRLNPLRHPDRALQRRDTVLDRMDRNGADSARVATAQKEPLCLQPANSSVHAPHVLRELREIAARENGVTTTLDLDLQRDVEAIVGEVLAPLADRGGHQAAVVVIDNASGGILTLVGSAGDQRPGGQLNGALLPRSAGSTLKPFTYLLAFEVLGSFPGSVIPDIPTRWRTLEGLDLPRNYDGRHRGPATVREALANSLNVPAMRQLETLGGPVPLAILLDRFGIGIGGQNPASFGLGLTIGNAEVTLLDLANGYATLARLGEHLPVTLIAREARANRGRGETLVSPESAWLVADILADNQARVPSFGSLSPLRLPFECAAKTGTSSDYRDNWCLGFTGVLTVGVWVGNFDGARMDGVSGVTGSGPIFNRVMARAHRGVEPAWPARPPGVSGVWTDSRTGRQLQPGSRAAQIADAAGTARREWCRSDSLPPVARASDYDPEGRVLLDARFSEWAESPDNQRGHQLAVAQEQLPDLRPQIIQPQDRATYLIDPELPSRGDSLRLISNLPGEVEWHSPSLPTDGGVLHLAPGDHTVRLTDLGTGRSTSVEIRVRTL